MRTKQLLAPTCLSALIYVSGCAGVGQDVQAGRNALQTGRANEAVVFLMRAADIDPNYKTPSRVPAGALTLLGRAYYETGKNAEARKTLEKAVSINKDDPLAHLYLGLTLFRDGDPERGRKEIEGGLNGIDETLEYIASDRVNGLFWDPGMQIRAAVRKTLAAKLDGAELAMAAQQIGVQFDEEIDKARREEGRARGGRGGDN